MIPHGGDEVLEHGRFVWWCPQWRDVPQGSCGGVGQWRDVTPPQPDTVKLASSMQMWDYNFMLGVCELANDWNGDCIDNPSLTDDP